MEHMHPCAWIRRCWRRPRDDKAHLLIARQWPAFVPRLTCLYDFDEVRDLISVGVWVVRVRQDNPFDCVGQEVIVRIECGSARGAVSTNGRYGLRGNKPRDETRRESCCYQGNDVLAVHQVDAQVTWQLEPEGLAVSGNRTQH
jgi:hypothetical protein